MNLFYKLIIIIGAFTLILFMYIFYSRELSKEGRLGKRNEINAAIIRRGKTTNEMTRIMGKADTVIYLNNEIIYHYLSNNIDYLDIEIYSDTNNFISKVFIPQN
jgi:hypothetical protein